MKRVIYTLMTILTLACIAYIACYYAHRYVFYRLTVLQVPIRFEPGFSLNREFTVDAPANYWVGIQYDEIFRSTVQIPVPQDKFTADCEIRLRDKVITKGGTRSLPSWTGPWASNRDQVTRYLASFPAKSGEKYSVSVQISDLLPGLVVKNPKVLVEIEPRFTPFYNLRKLLFICVAAVIGIVALIVSAQITLRSRRLRRAAVTEH
jgi:hypothetical protein